MYQTETPSNLYEQFTECRRSEKTESGATTPGLWRSSKPRATGMPMCDESVVLRGPKKNAALPVAAFFFGKLWLKPVFFFFCFPSPLSVFWLVLAVFCFLRFFFWEGKFRAYREFAAWFGWNFWGRDASSRFKRIGVSHLALEKAIRNLETGG